MKSDLLKVAIIGSAAFFVCFSFAQAFVLIGGAPDPQVRFFNETTRVSPHDLTGSLVYSIDLASPPGRNELQPSLKLIYNSNDWDYTSPFGLGWSINIPYIERINKYGTDRLYSTSTPSYFYSSLSGELATTTATTTFAARNDDGSFITYTFSGDEWLATDKNGNQYIFGTSTLSRQDNPDDSSQVFKWMLEEIRDANDNYIKYEYYKDNGQIYPSRVVYAGHGTTDGPFEVEFVREARSDTATSSITAFPVISNYRISEIKAEVSNTWVRKYVLGYSQASTGARSVLDSITESGQDEESNVITLPARDFGYSTATPGWTLDEGWTLPGLDFGRPGTYIIDLNGDGLVDVIQSDDGPGDDDVNIAYINNGDGTWTEDPNYDAPIELDFQNTYGAGLADLNGDGLVDIYHRWSTTNDVFLNTGSGWSLSTTWDMPDVDYQEEGTYIMDVNGDGLTDVLASRSYTSTKKTFINNGDGTWTEDPAWDAPIYLDYDQQYGAGVAELNGDGLPDMYRDWSTFNDIYINNGHGWTYVPDWKMPTGDQPYGNAGYVYLDINADGLSDFVGARGVGSSRITYLNKGNGTWDDVSSWYYPGGEWLSDNGAGITDINGDGIPDAFKKYSSTNWVRLGNTKKVDLLTYATNGTGGSLSYAYTPSTQYMSGASTTNPTLPYVLHTVSAIGESDGLGTTATTTYSYSGGDYYYNNPFDRRLAGFEVITKTDPEGNIEKTYYHQGNSTNSSLGEYLDDQSKIGRIFRVERSDSSSNVYSKEVQKVESFDLGNERNLVVTTRKTILDYDGDGDHKDKAETYSYATTTGNLTQRVQWGEVTGSNDGSFSDTGTDKYVLDISYAASSTALLTKPSVETLTNQGATKVKETKHYYDNLALGQVDVGNETKTEFWESGSDYASTTRSYNSYGIATQETDARGKITTHTLDAFNLFIATTTNPLSHVTAYSYNYGLGKVKERVDANGRAYQTIYDGLGRIKELKQPDLVSPSSLVTKTRYSYADNVVPTYTLKTDYLGVASSTNFYEYYDGLKRVIQERKSAESSFAVKDRSYNSRGLLAQESLPYFSSGASSTVATSTPALFSSYVYDPLRRILSITNAVGTTSKSYDDWKVTTTDANGEILDHYSDAYGNLVRVDEHNGGNTYTTYYEYDGLRNLTKITDALTNLRNFTYDGLGRRLTAQDLHASGDGTYGTWSYTYDDAGNITQTVDPNAQTIQYSYDDLNRVLTENYTGTGGVEVEYGYDTCTDGIGRVCVATTTDAVSRFVYNANGGFASETKTISSTDYTTSYSYDRQGNLTSITYPDNSEVEYLYDSNGLLDRVTRKAANSSLFVDAVMDIAYAPNGSIKFKRFGNGVESRYTYSPNQLYRLTNITTTATSTEEINGSLGLLSLPLSYFASNGLKLADLQYFAQATFDAFLSEDDISDADADVASTTLSETLPDSESDFGSSAIENSEEEVKTTPDISAPSQQQEAREEAALVTLPASVARKVFSYDPVSEIEHMIFNKSAKERATIKGREIAKLEAIPRTPRLLFDIEVVSMSPIQGGIEVFARAWDKQGAQVGFGADGSVDLERFRIFNPPILVPHQNGQILREWEAQDSKTGELITLSRTLREDTQEALLQVIEQNLSVMKNVHIGSQKIEKNKKGRTTSTFYTSPASSAPADGTVYRNLDDNFYAWTNIRNNEGNLVNYSAVSSEFGSIRGASIDGYTNMARSIFGFDTSPLGTDAISSATFSVFASADGNDAFGQRAVLDHKASVASTTVLSASDYNIGGWDGVRQSDTEIVFSSWDSGYAQNFALNATGTSNINKSGFTWFGGRTDKDMDNTQPSIPSFQTNSVNSYFADQSGTTQDPRLVVEHAAVNNPPSAPTSLETESQTNPENITDPTPEFSAIYTDSNAGDISTHYRIQVSTSTEFISLTWDSSKTSLASSTPEGSRVSAISYSGSALASTTLYYWRIKFWDDSDDEGSWSSATSTFSLAAENVAPISPTSLQTEGHVNPTEISDFTPELSAVYEDVNGSDQANFYQIQVATSSAYWGVPYWDSTKSAMATTSVGNRIPEISYTGNALASSTIYYWRIKFWDIGGLEGDWSTSTALFMIAQGSSGGLQNLTFTHDAVGNITQIQDTSDTSSNRTVEYVYDDLHRLISASTTSATSSPYIRTYSYNAIGNITSASDLGTYLYSGSGYINPHAVTEIGGVGATTTYAYDNNGNLTSGGSWTYTWNYRNRLTQATNGTPSTYGYDHEDQRVKKTTSGVTTLYPNKYFEKVGATTTSYIYLPDGTLVATVEGNGTATSTYYAHQDHLGSTNVVTDAFGDQATQVLDYYPYGSKRISSGSDVSKREYIGEMEDTETSLSYLNARYMDSQRGQFLSQDPAYLAVGTSNLTEIMDRANTRMSGSKRSENKSNKEGEERGEKERRLLNQFLSDPQQGNSYSYSRNNPVTLSDPEGEIAPVLMALGFSSAGAEVLTNALLLYGAASTAIDVFEYNLTRKYESAFTEQEKSSAAGDALLSALTFGAGFQARLGEAVILEAGGLILDTMRLTGAKNQDGPASSMKTKSNNSTIIESFNSQNISK